MAPPEGREGRLTTRPERVRLAAHALWHRRAVTSRPSIVRVEPGAERWLLGLGSYEGPDVRRVRDLLPEGFETYLRLLHAFVPWCSDEDVPTALPRWNWRELAETAGVAYSPTLMPRSLERATDVGGEPMLTTTEGRLDPVSRGALFAALADDAAARPDDDAARALFWFGLGAVVRAGSEPALYEGPVGAVDDVLAAVEAERDPGVAGPELVWPADRRWVVATDDDLASTYLAYSRALADRLLAVDALEVLVVDAHTRTDAGADRDERP